MAFIGNYLTHAVCRSQAMVIATSIGGSNICAYNKVTLSKEILTPFNVVDVGGYSYCTFHTSYGLWYLEPFRENSIAPFFGI